MKSVVHHLFSRPGHRPGMSSLSMCAAVVALAMSACGSSDNSSPGNTGGGGGGTPTEAGAPDDVGSFHATPVTCTKPNTVCFKMQVPATMDTKPVRLTFNIYDSPEPPVTPPVAYLGVFNGPSFTAGETVHFELTDGAKQGNYWIYAIMYMPNGGFGPPVLGVDYIQRVPTALKLDGSPLNIADYPVVLSK